MSKYFPGTAIDGIDLSDDGHLDMFVNHPIFTLCT
jgi:hypothetical protein